MATQREVLVYSDDRSPIPVPQPLADIGVLLGLLAAAGEGDYIVNWEWFGAPQAPDFEVADTRAGFAALVAQLLPVDPSPLVATVAGGTTLAWSPLPLSGDAAALSLVVLDSGDDLAVGLGGTVRFEVASLTVTLFAVLPLLRLPTSDGPLALATPSYPLVVGVRAASPSALVGQAYGFEITGSFVASPTVEVPTPAVFVLDQAGASTAVDLSSASALVTQLLGLDAVTSLLGTTLASGTTLTLGSLLVGLGVLTDTDGYALGDLSSLPDLTLEGLLGRVLGALSTSGPLVSWPNGALSVTRSGNLYGLGLALTDLSVPTGEGGPGVAVQLGKWFSAVGDPSTANWIGITGLSPGISLDLVEIDGEDFTLEPSLTFASVGVDLTGADGPLLAAGGLSVTSVQPRLYARVDPAGTPAFDFGAALFLDTLTVPLGSAAAGTDANPVASNMLGGSEAGDGGDDPATSGASTPAPELSLSVALTPLAAAAAERFAFQLYGLADGTETSAAEITLAIQAAFGPLHVDAIGIGYDASDAELSFLVDSSLSLGPLDVSLTGLGVGIPLAQPDVPTVSLQGLSVSYQTSCVQVSGGFLATGSTPPAYSGELSVQAGPLGLSALGAYAQVDGHPALFVFAALDAPIGGPPFFVVTGLAGGFGYNYSLRMPTIDEVAGYHLVAFANGTQSVPTGTDPQAVLAATLTSLGDDLQPSYGDFWFAAGVRFTTFEMLQSFALVAVAVSGQDVSLDLIGLSNLTVPFGVPDAEVIARAQLSLLVSFSTSTGLLAVEGQLTDASYVLSPDCKLTGGFALYAWFEAPEAGNFVVTLGGYAPTFPIPAGFPNPPRLGLDWTLGQLHINGGLYFALTTSCVMAGGSLGVVYTNDADTVTAWFKAYADFLLHWKPFAYSVDMGISVGVAVNLFGLTGNESGFTLSVDLYLAGPPFGGSATIDLSICSFVIDFGDTDPDDSPICWTEFETSFLPAGGADDPTTGNASVFQIGPTAGLLGTITDPSTPSATAPLHWILNPEQAALSIQSVVPATAITWGGKPVSGASCSPGVAPVGIAAGDVTTDLVIHLKPLDGQPDPTASFRQVATLQAAPAALWGPPHPGKPKAEAATVSAVIGLVLTATVQAPHEAGPFSVSAVLTAAPAERDALSLAPPTPLPPVDYPPLTSAEALAELAGTIAADGVAVQRAAVITALQSVGLVAGATVDVANLASAPADFLLAAPVFATAGS